MIALAILILAAAAYGAATIAQRLRIWRHFHALAALSLRSTRTLARRHASDWAKERATRILAWRMMQRSAVAGAALALVAAPIGLALALGALTPIPTHAAFVDPDARLALLACGACLVLYRCRRLLRLA